MNITVWGIDVEVEIESWPAQRGARENGVQLEPDEEAGFEITSIQTSENFIDFLGVDSLRELEEAITERARDAA